MTIDSREFAANYFSELQRVIAATSTDDLGRVLDALVRAHREGRQVFVIGNGGSASTASHMANDLTWGLTRKGIKPMRAVALTDNVALMTAIANDESYGAIFSRQLEALATEGDLLVAISGSGNSANIVHALDTARRMSLTTIGILGMDGGAARTKVDAAIVISSQDYGPIEDMHMVVDHLALAFLRVALAQ